MGGNSMTYIEVPHLVWEAFTSSNHFIQVAKPPSMRKFAPLLWGEFDNCEMFWGMR